MKIKIDTIQKRVGFLIATVGVFVLITNFIDNAQKGLTFTENILSLNIWLISITLLLGFLTILYENKVMKFIQVFLLILTGTLNMLTSYNEVYGPSLVFMAWLLMRQYGYFDVHKRIKYGILLALLAIIVQFSAFIHNMNVFILRNDLFQFSIFMVLFLLAIWKDIFERDERLFKENQHLKSNYREISKKIEEIEKDKKPYDLRSAGVSPAEERVLKTLVLYRASNKEIAERLNISEPTVKLHMYNIFNKLGVDSRFTVIDLCKYNYKTIN